MSLFQQTSSIEKDRIENRLFEVSLILTLIVLVFWSVLSLVFDYTLIIKAIYFSGLLFYSGLYFAHKKGVSFTLLTAIYYSAVFVLLIVGWLPSGGITGPIMHMVVLVYASGLLVLPTRAFMAYIFGSMLLVIGFGFYEINDPEAANYYKDRPSEIQDLTIACLLIITILGYALYLFKKSYISDRQKLSDAIDELAEAKEVAESADRSKTKFLATISHEMRTPLNGIIGLSELLGRTNLSDEQKEILSGLTYSSELLHSLISDVLDLTLIEDDKLVLQENEIDIKKEIDSILEVFQRRLDSKSGSINLSLDHDEEIPHDLLIDVTRFRQILINLINNAIKFTYEGYIVVKSQLKELKSDQALIEFSVSDTGTGIPEEKKSLIFQKFYKANEDQTIEGTGLGLSICKNLVEAMKGLIDFESEEGVGTIFYFQIPFPRGTREKETTSDESGSKGSYQNLKVLVAEDVKINQMVISKMLKNLGIESFDIVENGIEAVEKSNEHHYDFILMDVQMPKKNGIEAAREILMHQNGAAKPKIIAVTANVMSGEREECTKAGMKDFISKPITSEMLREVFDKHLQD